MWLTNVVITGIIASTLVASPSTNAQMDLDGPYNCSARVDAPHPSGGLIKSHTRIRCKFLVKDAKVTSQLWRLRAWGWERIGPLSEYKASHAGKFFDTSAKWKPDGCYYYRATGMGYITGFDGVRIDTPGAGINYDRRFLKGLPPGCGTNWR